MQIFGHRGARALEPENTLRSFRKALEHNVAGVELDVHVCKSGEIMVIHDDAVDRTTNGKGFVKDLSFSELRKLDAGKGEKIPSLAEVFDLVGKDKAVFIEIKNAQNAAKTAEFVTSYVEKNDYSYENLPVISFYPAALAEINKINPRIKLGANFSSHNEDRGNGRYYFKQQEWQECVEKIINSTSLYSLNPCFIDLSWDIVKMAKMHGLKVFSWTINDPEVAKNAQALKVEGIFTDDPSKIKSSL